MPDYRQLSLWHDTVPGGLTPRPAAAGADLIAGRRSALTALPWVGHRSRAWEPEPLRWLGANAALRAMAWADRAENRGSGRSRTAALVDSMMGRR